MREGMVVVGTFVNNAEAELALGHLRAMGIPGLLEGDNCGGMRPHLDLTGGVFLLVPEAAREQATALLRGLAEPVSTEPWTCDICGEEIEAGFDACWSCGNPRP